MCSQMLNTVILIQADTQKKMFNNGLQNPAFTYCSHDLCTPDNAIDKHWVHAEFFRQFLN